jgi:hypothetical protein
MAVTSSFSMQYHRGSRVGVGERATLHVDDLSA